MSYLFLVVLSSSGSLSYIFPQSSRNHTDQEFLLWLAPGIILYKQQFSDHQILSCLLASQRQ